MEMLVCLFVSLEKPKFVQNSSSQYHPVNGHVVITRHRKVFKLFRSAGET